MQLNAQKVALLSHRFWEREFGMRSRICWQPDVFGVSGVLPQILKRMKTEGRSSGADARGIKGLFRLSKQGQDRVQALLWPKTPPPVWRQKLLDAITSAADRSDRWLAARAPVT